MTERIYVALLNEGTNVWRPVEAERMSHNTYRIALGLDPAAMDEEWAFPPGAIVVCGPRQLRDGTIHLTAVRLA